MQNKNEILEIVADTLYGEARGEIKIYGDEALIAIANVIDNRMKKQTWYGKTFEKVCLKPKQFSCWNENDPNLKAMKDPKRKEITEYQICLWVANQLLEGKLKDITKGSNHYHHKNITPYWAKNKQSEMTIGNHIFYCL